MTKKTVKDLALELDAFKEGFADMKKKYEDLQDRCIGLEKRIEGCMCGKTFKCASCGKHLRTNRELKLHQKMLIQKETAIKCDECEQYYTENWKLNAHKNNQHQVNVM